MIDAHQHFWRFTTNGDFDWVTDEMAVLRQDFLPSDLRVAACPSGVTGTIAVQARTSLKETTWLLQLAAQTSLVKGVVGWIPLQDPAVAGLLDELKGNPYFLGAREILQNAPDERFLGNASFDRGIEELTRRDLAYDLLIFHHQLPAATRFVDRHPEQRFILDHIAKPEIRQERPGEWEKNLRELARRPQVSVKFSGVVTEVKENAWSVELLRPYFETVLEAFGPTRAMFGSDWPVCLLRSGYAAWVKAVRELAGTLTTAEAEAFFSGTARVSYQLKG